MKAVGLAIALMLSPASRDADRAIERPTYAARTALGYEVYTWFVEDRRDLAGLVFSECVEILPAGTTYRILPLQGNEHDERPVCAKIRVMRRNHMDRTVYVIADDLKPGKGK
jgi:hypothetical protein